MATTTDTAMRIERLLENHYAQEQLREGVESLRAAYGRVSKRRLKAADDKRVRRQVQSAAASLTEAAKAFRSDRRKPKPRWGRRLMVLAGVGGLGAGAAVVIGKGNKGDSEVGEQVQQGQPSPVPGGPVVGNATGAKD